MSFPRFGKDSLLQLEKRVQNHTRSTSRHFLSDFSTINIKRAKEPSLLWPTPSNCFLETVLGKLLRSPAVSVHTEKRLGVCCAALTHRCQLPGPDGIHSISIFSQQRCLSAPLILQDATPQNTFTASPS